MPEKANYAVKETPLDVANAEVTRAILHAERQTVGTDEYVAAWRDVAKWEQRIADLTVADSLEGEIARRGVLTARAKAEGTE